jgi:polygalacturonase
MLLAAAATAAFASAARADTFNVRDYGAKGDGTTNDRAAIQKAIDACAGGGGTVVVPAGDYLTGKIELRSRVTLLIEPGATLRQSPDKADYGGWGSGNLLVARDAEDIALVGFGRIHGTGTADYGRGRGGKDKPEFRTGILLFENCRNVHIRDLTILYSDAWTVHLRRCQGVFIDGLTIRNNYYRTNSDGIDPNSCRDVHISNCRITAGDDCIVLKATQAEPCENVVVTNCTLETIATALKLGTESRGDFRDIHFSNCVIRNSTVGIGFFMKDGATMERVTFSNISIENPTTSPEAIVPIFMDIERRNPDSKIGRIRDVSFRDIAIAGGMGVVVQGMPENPIENLTFDNITFRVENPRDYAKRRKHVGGSRTTSDERDTLYVRQPSYFTVANVKGLIVEDLRVLMSEEDFRKYPRSAFSGHNIDGGALRNVSREPAGAEGDAPILALENCRRLRTSD